MRLFIDPALAARHPGYRMFTVVATGIDNRGGDAELEARLTAAQEELRRRPDLDPPEAHPRIAAWHEAFRAFGADPEKTLPSVEALVRRVRKGDALPFVNKVVAASNLVSLTHLLPSGGDDLVRIHGDFGLRPATGFEEFLPINEEEAQPVEPNEVIYTDEEKVLCRRWIWRQSETSKITPDSVHVAVNVDVLPPATEEEGLAAARELAALIEKHCGGSTEILRIGGEVLSEPVPPPLAARVAAKRLETDEVRRLIEKHGSRLSDSGDMADWSLFDLLQRGNMERIVVESEFLDRLSGGEKIRIYQGFDPTSPDLHVGHMVSLRILRWFQIHGHEVTFLLGDATAMIGDPSGRSEQREMLARETVSRNLVTYREQAGMILDFDHGTNPVRVRQNSEWLLSMKLEDVLRLMSTMTAQRLLERDMFRVRLKKNEPLYYVETIYPLLQGYDSVALETDAELGGRDQLFNMMVGRDLARSFLGRDKHVLTTPLLAGFDGRKMSKTYGNTVNVTASPFDLFEGVMRVNDDLALTYARLLTDLSWPELAEMEAALPADPLGVKERIAFAFTRDLLGPDAAEKAHREFIEVRRRGVVPTEMPAVRLPATEGEATLLDLLAGAEPRVVKSKSELRRLIAQGGVSLGDARVEDGEEKTTPGELQGRILRIGKKRFFRLEAG